MTKIRTEWRLILAQLFVSLVMLGVMGVVYFFTETCRATKFGGLL